jgi:signal transduction histidine kinase
MPIAAWTRSLTVRLALLTGAWAAMGLLFVWLWVTAVITDAEETSFDARLVSLVDALVAAVELRDGQPVLTRPVSEPRFDRPLSGAYFQIEAPHQALLTSRSLGTALLPEGKFGHRTVLIENIEGPRSQHLRLAERDITPPDSSSDGDNTIHILVAIARDDAMRDAAAMRNAFALGFALIGAGLVAAVVLQVSLGLRGLQRLRGAVIDLRAGGEVAPGLAIPREIQPLLAEIETLVRQNRATVQRARSHVGNLAHALRTRLSVIRNAVETTDTSLARRELTEADRLVQHHLIRARTAALSGAAANTIPIVAAANDIARAMRILFADRTLTIAVIGDPALHVRCEHEDLTELLANLIENACKWARTTVAVTIQAPSGPSSDGQIVAAVSDDGPGMSEDQIRDVGDRGVRLDETIPGSGLGLAIAIDLATLYGGGIDLLGHGPHGGLQASVALPQAPPPSPRLFQQKGHHGRPANTVA